MVEQKHVDIAIKILNQERNMRYKVFNNQYDKDKQEKKMKEIDYCMRLIKALWEQTKQTKLL